MSDAEDLSTTRSETRGEGEEALGRIPLHSFVRLSTSEPHWSILPALNVGAFSLALPHFVREFGSAKDERMLLVLDQAGWHTGKEAEMAEPMELGFLPAHSPELQPAEGLRPPANEALANRSFEDWDKLQNRGSITCLKPYKGLIFQDASRVGQKCAVTRSSKAYG